jgi:predicted  nucleic acid-binding Zn-ribbon protein
MDDQEVKYQFTGDVSSLREATEGALQLLTQYQDKIKSLTNENAFTTDKKVTKSLQTNLNAASKAVTDLQSKMKGLGDVKMPLNSEATRSLSSGIQTLQNNFDKLSNSSKVTAKDVRALVAEMKTARQEIQNSGSGVEQIVQKEIKWQDTLEKVSNTSTKVATNVKTAMDQIKSAVGNLTAPLGNVASAMQSMKDKAANALGRIGQLAQAAGAGFRVFKGDTEDADASHSKLASVLSRITGLFKKETSEVENEDQKLDKKNNTLKKSSTLHTKLTSLLSKLGSAFKNEAKHLTSFISNLKSANSQTNLLNSAISKLIQTKLGDWLASAIDSSISYVENMNLFTVAMGDSAEAASEFLEKMAEIYGMDLSNLYKYSGYFYQLTDAIGMTSDASETMSLSLTKAANDMASLFNTDVQSVVDDLASGMQGMSRAVRKYGIDIRSTTLQQTALNYGFTENVSATSEANRQALRYLTIMKQIKNATQQTSSSVDGATTVMGDFARTIEAPANQLRIFKEQISSFARSIGNFFIPVLQSALYVVNGFIMALTQLFTWLAALLGIDTSSFGGGITSGAEDATSAVSDIGDEADSTAKKLKNLVSPFDELTILSQNADSSSGSGSGSSTEGLDAGLAAAIADMSLDLEDIRMKALDVRDEILALFGLSWDDSELVVTAGGFIDDLMKLWDAADYTGFGERVAQFINQGIEWGIGATDPSKWSPILNEKVQILAELLNGFVAGLDWEGLGNILGNGITIALGMLNTWFTTFDYYSLGASLADGLNGIVEAVDWDLLGETIGNYFMSKINKLKGFLDEFDFAAWGASLGTGLMSALDTIDWETIGNTVGSAVQGFIDIWSGFFETYEWGTLGTDIATGINAAVTSIDWGSLASTISDALAGVIEELRTLVTTLDWKAIAEAIADFLKNVDWMGLLGDVAYVALYALASAILGILDILWDAVVGIANYIVEGFQDGIIAGLANIGTWLWDHFIKPIIDAVKDFFGIHSPSTVFAEIGGYLIEGFKNGILDTLKNIGNWIKENIIDPVINNVKSFFGISSSSSTSFSDIGKSLMDGLKSGVTGSISAVVSTFSGLYSKIQEVFAHVSDWFKDKFSKAWQAVKDVFSTGGKVFDGIKEGILSGLKAVINALIKGINKVIKIPFDGINSALKTIKNISILGAKPFSFISTISVPQIPQLATGGVVTKPTYAMIGEGKYDEAVVPLGDSPQMQELVDKIAEAVNGNGNGNGSGNTPIEVHVYLDGTEITNSQNRANRMYGRTQQNV